MLSVLGRAIRGFTSTLANGGLRALLIVWTLGIAGDAALLVVGLLAAYDVGGPVAVGTFGLIRMLPATAVNALVDSGHLRRPERALIGANLVRGIGALAIAASLAAGAPAAVFVVMALVAAAGAVVRPTALSLMPTLAATPEELVEANAVLSLGASIGAFAGPLLAAGVLTAAGPVPTAAVAAVALLAAAGAALGVRVSDAARPVHPEHPSWSPLANGLRALRSRPPAAMVIGSFVAQTAVRGALTTYLVVLAVEVLGLGDAGIGTLGAILGLGGMAGALASMAPGQRRAFAPIFALALVGWGAPLSVIGFVPVLPVVVIALFVVGLSDASLDVAGFTLVHRGVPARSLGAVFSVMEVGVGATVAAGSVAGGVLAEALGVQRALALSGLLLPLVAILGWRVVRRLDSESIVPEREASLLRSIPLFAALPLSAVERLAAGMRPLSFAAGEALMVEGDPGDDYFVIASGTVKVLVGGREVRRQGPGDGVGEIALLRRVRRTATVTALEPVDAYLIDRETFLAAITGHAISATTAETLVAARLTRPEPEAPKPRTPWP